MRYVASVLLVLVACGAPATTVLYPGGPKIGTPSKSPIRCPENTSYTLDRASYFKWTEATEWCELPDGTKHGPFRRYTRSNRVREQGNYDHGKKIGSWLHVSKNDPFIVEMLEFHAGKPVGQLDSFITCKYGGRRFSEIYEKCSTVRVPYTSGQYGSDGKRDGLWVFHDDGLSVLMKLHFSHGIKNGLAEFRLHRQVWPHQASFVGLRGGFTDGVPTGNWTKWRTDEVIEGVGPVVFAERLKTHPENDTRRAERSNIAEPYIEGLIKDGEWVEYGGRERLWGTGALNRLNNKGDYDHGRYSSGKRMGTWTGRYADGTLRSTYSYVLGQLEGPYQEWTEAGTLRVEGGFKAGKSSGLWKKYFPNGSLNIFAELNDGKKNGIWLVRDLNGTTTEEDNYLDGEKLND